VRRTDGHLGSAPITFIAELALYRLETAQKLRYHHLVDVVGAGTQVPRRGLEQWSHDVRLFGEVRTEVRRSQFGSPQ
jgi:hypothetical protein